MDEVLNQLLIVGQTPPPWHGQAVATKMLIDHEWSDWELSFARMAYSDDLNEVGGFRWKKIGHLFSLTREVRAKLKGAPGTVMLYPPASASWLPFLRDVYFLMRTRKLARGTAFIFHASGLPAFVDGSFIRRFLAKLAYGNPDLSLEVAQEKVRASEVFGAKAAAWCPCAAELPVLPPWTPCADGVRRVLFVGSLMEGKGIYEILKTAKVLAERGENQIKFAIVGRWVSEQFRKECEGFVQKHHLEDVIDFRGQLTGEDKWRAFQEAEVFFFPSHYTSEASPIVLMEALGMGLSVVSTQWAGIPAMAGDCEAVRLCPVKEPERFADALLETLAEDAGDGSLSAKAKEFYQARFTPESFIQRIQDGLKDSGLFLSGFQSWKTEQELVLPLIRRVALGTMEIGMLALNDRIVLGLPRNAKLASAVIGLYRPMRSKARFLTSLMERFAKLGVFRFLPSGTQEKTLPEISWLQGVSDIGFLGCNPSHGIRCVLLSRAESGPMRVTKLAIGENLTPVEEEAEKLRNWSGRYEGLIHFGGFEKGEDWAAFWTDHLPEKGPQTLSDGEPLRLLESWLGDGRIRLGDLRWVVDLCQGLEGEIRDQLMSQEVRGALVHGDFTPWNLRSDGKRLLAVDWEWAVENGPSGLDLGHGFLMEALLLEALRGEGLINKVLAMANDPKMATYLKNCGWDNLHLWLLFSMIYSCSRSGHTLTEEHRLLKEILLR